MKYIVKASQIKGEIDIPASKSHTIRALAFALLCRGESIIEHPLDSLDTRSCAEMIEKFGAKVNVERNLWQVKGVGKDLPVPDDIIDVGNSGTSLYIGMGIASLINGYTIFTGDHQIRNRSAEGLLKSINDLGGEAFSSGNNGKPPLVIKGPVKEGVTSIEAVTSQYLTSLLIAAPMSGGNIRIRVPLLNEKPYVAMTLRWLDKLGIEYRNTDYKEFYIKGNQNYRPFKEYIPADFSSAAFFMVAAAITGGEVNLKGLDFNDSQGDKEVVKILEKMGASVEIGKRNIKIKGGKLRGGTFDLNAIPDALPALSVAAACAEGETRLINVPQARLKETDRISVMSMELSRIGADIEELEHGLVVRKSTLKGGVLNGHGDHRVVMALSVAGLCCEDGIEIDTAESVAVTFPDFIDLMRKTGADIEKK